MKENSLSETVMLYLYLSSVTSYKTPASFINEVWVSTSQSTGHKFPRSCRSELKESKQQMEDSEPPAHKNLLQKIIVTH